MLGGGCGRELAHWIIHGRPEKDMYGYDIRQGSSGTHHLWEVLGMGFEHPMGAGIRTCCLVVSLPQSPSPQKPESITPHGFTEFTPGVYLICLIPLLHKQLPANARRLQ